MFFSREKMQQRPARTFTCVDNIDSGTDWKNIFAFLHRETAVAHGRADDRAAELRRKLDLFARGEIPEEEIDGFCADIASSPEALEALAELLRKPDGSLPP
jgi:hypothetical protein